MKLSSRQRRCLKALAQQREWPAHPRNSDYGWVDPMVRAAPWVPDTRKLLASLVPLGLVSDDSTTTVGRPMSAPDRALMMRARRYTITDKGKELADAG